MALKADRYTVLVAPLDEIKERIKSVDSLDLQWFCTNSSQQKACVNLYIFFDKAGMNNYLNGIYGQTSDDIRRLLLQMDSGELSASEALDMIKGLLGY